MSKILYASLIILTLLGLSSVLWWLYGATNGFNRGIGLHSLAGLLYFIAPLALTILISIIYLIRKGTNPEGGVSVLIVSAICLVITSLSIVVVFHPNVRSEPVRDFIHSDTLRPTHDGLFEYRLDLVNLFQRNASARLFVRDLTTGEEVYIPLRISVRGVGGISTPGGNFLRARMEQSELEGHYILRMPPGTSHHTTFINGDRFEFRNVGGRDSTPIQATFLIDIPNATSTRIE